MNGLTMAMKMLKGVLVASASNENDKVLLTSEELVFVKADLAYYILLRDIVSVSPYTLRGREMGFVSQSEFGEEIVNVSLRSNYFQVKVNHALVLTGGSTSSWGKADLIIKMSSTISKPLLKDMAS